MVLKKLFCEKNLGVQSLIKDGELTILAGLGSLTETVSDVLSARATKHQVILFKNIKHPKSNLPKKSDLENDYCTVNELGDLNFRDIVSTLRQYGSSKVLVAGCLVLEKFLNKRNKVNQFIFATQGVASAPYSRMLVLALEMCGNEIVTPLAVEPKWAVKEGVIGQGWHEPDSEILKDALSHFRIGNRSNGVLASIVDAHGELEQEVKELVNGAYISKFKPAFAPFGAHLNDFISEFAIRSGEKALRRYLLRLPTPTQDRRAPVHFVGRQTVELCMKCGFSGIIVSSNDGVIVDIDEAKELINKSANKDFTIYGLPVGEEHFLSIREDRLTELRNLLSREGYIIN